MVQVPQVAMFLRGEFPVCLRQFCSIKVLFYPLLRLDEAFLPELLIISLSLLLLIIFDKYWSKAAMARRGPNKWNKEDSAMFIDLGQKNPAIWDTKSNEYMDS